MHSDEPEYLEAAAEARNVLDDMAQWRLTPARWAHVEAMLDSMAAALLAGDLHAMRAAVGELELVSPVRVVRIGSSPEMDPPEIVRERRNELVHALGTAERPGPPPQGGADERSGTR
ncbi:hypothetical protein J5X84_24735 [Streptosporangiaceae bacterium NEAU-GS5]|nr:hypothetical protein [Streptosporangiaceae bacterium NEAU-GS5]